MSKPTPREELYLWHTEALENVSLHLDVEANPDEPHCGWFECRLVKGGSVVPARIFMVQPVDENGDLIGDEVMQAEINGEYRDPAEAWSWLCARPISESRFNFLTEDGAWARAYAPDDPKASPRAPVDWLALKTPEFNEGTDQ